LRTQSMTLANGAPFVVGHGVTPATLELQGCTFTFADGLVISPNATVTGCGMVIGPITNNGTYTNSCGGQPPTPTIAGVSKSGNAVTVICTSQNGFTYQLEFKQTLSDPAWTQILPGLPGNGGALDLIDSGATNRSRFYRVRVR